MPTLIDPTSEREPVVRANAPRLRSIEGSRVALLDISKPRGDVFLAELGRLLQERGAAVSHHRKPTFTKPAPTSVREAICASSDAVVEGLAD